MTAKKRVNGRQKGATAERKLAKLFSAWWGSEFTRTPMSGGFATARFREDWNAQGDLVTPDKGFPFCVESKKVEGWTLEQLLTSNKTLVHKWWEQTVRESGSNLTPLLVFTKNRAPLYAMITHEEAEFGDLIKHLERHTSLAYFRTRVNGADVIIFPLTALFETSSDKWRTE